MKVTVFGGFKNPRSLSFLSRPALHSLQISNKLFCVTASTILVFDGSYIRVGGTAADNRSEGRLKTVGNTEQDMGNVTAPSHFGVFTAVLNIHVCWHMTPYLLVNITESFRVVCCLHLHDMCSPRLVRSSRLVGVICCLHLYCLYILPE